MTPKPILKLKPPASVPGVIYLTVEILKGPRGYTWLEADKDNIVLATSRKDDFFTTAVKAGEDYGYYHSLCYSTKNTVQVRFRHSSGEAQERVAEIRRENRSYSYDMLTRDRFVFRRNRPRLA